MRPSLLASVALFVLVPVALVEPTPDPLRLIPRDTDLLVKVEQPGRLLEAVTHNDLVRQLSALGSVRELYDSTNAHRLRQLLAYFERQLGANQSELLDRLAGGGIALGLKLGPQPAPALLVVQSRDEQMAGRFLRLALAALEQELERQDSKDRIERRKYRGIECLHLGQGLHAASVGSALLVSNVDKALERGVDLFLDGDKQSLARVEGVAGARRLVGPDPAAWMWFNLETVRLAPEFKDLFSERRNDAQLTVVFGGLLDVARRAPFVCAGLYASERSARFSFRLPSGIEGMRPEIAAHLPASGQIGSRPLLEPGGVLASTSFYLDPGKFWERRATLFNDKQLKSFEEFDKNSTTFLAGARFSKLVGQLGAYHRAVVAHSSALSYKIKPAQYLPAFALVSEVREPEPFTKRIGTILRSAALLASAKVSLKLFEEEYQGRHIVGYRFPEDGTFPGDANNLRFNFVPCFVGVGNQFVVSSSLELCHQLIDLLEQEESGNPAGSTATTRTQIYAAGLAELATSFRDRLFTQTILNQAIPPAEAKEQVQTLIDLIRQAGVLQLEAAYGPREFHYDIRLRYADKGPERTTPKEKD